MQSTKVYTVRDMKTSNTWYLLLRNLMSASIWCLDTPCGKQSYTANLFLTDCSVSLNGKAQPRMGTVPAPVLSTALSVMGTPSMMERGCARGQSYGPTSPVWLLWAPPPGPCVSRAPFAQGDAGLCAWASPSSSTERCTITVVLPITQGRWEDHAISVYIHRK